MVLLVVPAMLWARSGVAAIVAGAWLGGQVAYLTGLPLLPVQFLFHVGAIVLTLGNTTKEFGLIVGAIFIARTVNDASVLSHVNDPVSGWWYDFWLAWLQLGFVVLSVDWKAFKTNVVLGAKGVGMPNLSLMVGQRG